MWIWVLLLLSEISFVRATQHKNGTENTRTTPTAEEVSATLDEILDDYDHRLRPNISEGPLKIQSDVFITGKIRQSSDYLIYDS